MKKSNLSDLKAVLTTLVFAALSFMVSGQASAKSLPHLDLEMTGQEYRRVIGIQNSRFTLNEALDDASQVNGAAQRLAAVISAGERNLDWLEYMNSRRPDQLRLTTPGSLKGIPIDRPKEYSDVTILRDFQNYVGAMPPEMKKVLIDQDPFTDSPPVAIQTYLEAALALDKIYQGATRWILLEPYLFQLEMARPNDIRGYYFLTRESDLSTKLNSWSTLPADEQAKLTEWLVGLCGNSTRIPSCRTAFARAVSGNQVERFYQNYLPAGQRTFEGFFKLDVRRNDVAWSATHTEAKIPFLDPGVQAVRQFLANIEDEWKWSGWKLLLDYRPSGSHARVEFKPGVTPHVNGLGGNLITMDANASLEEWDTQWTIRHEFGHVIGFPDCYVEYYDSERSLVVNYQIDTENLMCSRRGKLQEGHFLELKRLYAH